MILNIERVFRLSNTNFIFSINIDDKIDGRKLIFNMAFKKFCQIIDNHVSNGRYEIIVISIITLSDR